MEADAERYRQEYESEMREKGLEAYDWDALCSANEDTRGWLCIPDTLINFPVVGTEDNAFYLSHDFTGDKSSAGCPFMDKDTQVWDFNRVIYGHNMGAGSQAMFSTLLKYEQEEYFKEHQTIYFTDAYGSAAAYQVMLQNGISVPETMKIWKATMYGWSSCREGHCIMRSLTMRPQASLPLLPVTGGCMGRTGGFL